MRLFCRQNARPQIGYSARDSAGKIYPSLSGAVNFCAKTKVLTWPTFGLIFSCGGSVQTTTRRYFCLFLHSLLQLLSFTLHLQIPRFLSNPNEPSSHVCSSKMREYHQLLQTRPAEEAWSLAILVEEVSERACVWWGWRQGIGRGGGRGERGRRGWGGEGEGGKGRVRGEGET